jgi:hypothetical protein
MTEQPKNNNVTDIEDAATVRWLAKTLEPARQRARKVPSAEAVDRIRAQVFGETQARRTRREIAA